MMDELLNDLKRFRQRLRLRDGWLLAQRTLWLASAAAVLILGAGRVWPVENLVKIALIPAAVWLLAVPGYAWLRPLPAMMVAQRVDGELGLKERLSTSLALLSRDGKLPEEVKAGFRPELVERLHLDALQTAAGIQPARAFPLHWLKRPLLLAAGLVLAAALLAVLPNPMDQILAERESVKQAAQQQAQKIDELKKQVDVSQELTPEEREDLLRKLDELARQLRENRGDREAALAELSKAEEALRQKLQPNAAARQAALEALAAQLQALSKSEGQQKPGDLKAAAEDLQKLAEQMKEMNASERQALASTLSQMAARAGQAGDASLAQALADLAMATQAGDAKAASRASQQAAQALQSAGKQMADQTALQRALAQMQSSRQAMTQAGQSRAQGQGQNQPGAGQNPGQGQGQNGQGQGSQPGTGGGSTANQLPPNQGSGKAKPPQGSKTGSTGADLTGQQVYAPQGGKAGEIFIPGQDTGQGTTQEKETKDPLPGAPNPALVPYREVYQRYMDAASQALEQSYIPSGLKDYVKGYFEELGQ